MADSMRKTQFLVSDFILPEAVSSIQVAIERVNGNEVFLIGRLDKDLMITDVDVYAMGNRNAVPAVIKEARCGDVIIHNHPDGILEPSEADIEIASITGSLGVGFYIVDNNVEYIYPVVKAVKEHTHGRLEFEELSSQFLPDGNFAKKLQQFEYRQPQIEMLKSVIDAFNENSIAIIEAGTGTGKSLAYLLPAVFWSAKNQERVVVSTNTINLQEQLIEKDIPLLKKCCGLSFKSVLVKGRNNYICLRKVHNLRAEGGTLIEDDYRRQLNKLLEWAMKTRDGSKADLNFIPYDDVWEAIQSEADQCTRLKCPFYDKCFFYIARRDAASADILVVNHYLLMADLIVRQETKGYDTVAILPPFKKIVIDEAHHLEEVATSNMSYVISRLRIVKILGRLVNLKDAKKGLLQYLKSKLKEIDAERDKPKAVSITDKINTEIMESRQILYDSTVEMFEDIFNILDGYITREELQKDKSDEIKLRLTTHLTDTEIWHTIEVRLKTLCVQIREFVSLLKDLLDDIGRLSKSSQDVLSSMLIDIASCKTRLKVVSDDIALFIMEDESSCKWIEIKWYREGASVRFCRAPLSVSDGLKACLYDNYDTIVLTSATLAIGKSFKFYKENTGLRLIIDDRLTELILDSPFDYKKQAIIGIPTDISEPDAVGYTASLEENIFKTVEISEGRALILFTSYNLLNNLYQRLAPRITQLGYTCLKQGMDNRHNLLESFKKDKTSVLFATDSFWEGIDVRGDALECVVLTRLPFKVPTEPIIEARAEAIEKAGGNAFYDFSLPMAVIKFKQGFGRLIRSCNDRGAVIIFDSRVVNKRYGHIFLNSLPEIRCIKDKKEVVFREMHAFFHNTKHKV